MDIAPIFKSLRKQKTAALLIAFEIALACAIICNALFVMVARTERMQIDSGVVESELLRIRSATLDDQADRPARIAADLAALRQVAGVVDVAAVQQVPFGNSSWNTSLSLERDGRGIASSTNYFDSGNLVQTLGLTLVAGRDFLPEEYLEFEDMFNAEARANGVAIITQALAERLWPGESALGRQFYPDTDPVTVVGIVKHLVRPSFRGSDNAGNSTIYPVRHTPGAQYVLRFRGRSADAVRKDAEEALRVVHPSRLTLGAQSFTELRERYFRGDRVMTLLLGGVVVALLIVTALGIVGLASFWVQRRRRQIGVRRALGATRGDILRYFQLENFLIVSLGVAVGMFAAYAVNAWLMLHYALPRLPLMYLPVGAFGLWLLGQASVLPPALRAMRVPPALATRA